MKVWVTMTIKEVKEMYKGKYADFEVYKPLSKEHYPNRFHIDNCKYTENYNEDSKVGMFNLMDEEDYKTSINAYSSMEVDFYECYGNKDAKVLCVMLA